MSTNQEIASNKEEFNLGYSLALFSMLILSLGYLTERISIPPLDWLFGLSKCSQVSKQFWMTIFLILCGYIFYVVTILRPRNLEGSCWDIMRNLEHKEKTGFSTWEWSHFISYLFFAFVCPNDWKLVFVMGIFFELFELLVGWFSGDLDFWTSQTKNVIAFDDVKANILGYATGHVILGFLGK